MPLFETGLYRFIVADAAVSAVIGDRFYRVRAPQKAKSPYAVYTTVFASTEAAMDEISGLTDRTVQISLFGTAVNVLEELAESMRLAFGRLRGEAVGIPGNRIWVHDFAYQLETFEVDTKLFHVVCQMDLLHSASA